MFSGARGPFNQGTNALAQAVGTHQYRTRNSGWEFAPMCGRFIPSHCQRENRAISFWQGADKMAIGPFRQDAVRSLAALLRHKVFFL